MKDKKSLIIYFSRADENYFGGEMRYVDKGNTEVIAEYIKELNKLNIKTSQKNEMTNDIPAGQVVRCSKEPNDYVDVENSETVVVYVAVAKPEEETEEATQTAEASDGGAQEGDPPVEGGIPVE